MANFAITNAELLDTVNYLTSGPYSIGQEVEGVGESETVYFTNNTEPYIVPISSGAPVPAPAQDEWIRTDCFGSVTIYNPNQKISIGGQLRCFMDYNVDTLGPNPSPPPANTFQVRVLVGILRYTGTPDNLLTAGTELVGTRTSLFQGVINPAPAAPYTSSVGNQIMLSYLDQPGLEDYLTQDPITGSFTPTVGTYTYWLQFYIEPVIGTLTVQSFYADVRSVYINVIKS